MFIPQIEPIINLAPPSELMGDYYKRDLPWVQFEKRYLNHIRQIGLQNEIQTMAFKALNLDITLLCIEKSPEYCHRRLLAEECLKYEPGLELYIK